MTELQRPPTAWLPTEFSYWAQSEEALTASEVQTRYGLGFAGAWKDPIASRAFRDRVEQGGGDVNGARVMRDHGIAGIGEGKLSIPFVFVDKLLPGALPGPAQERGDCVSHSQKNASLITMICDIVSGRPDEVTGVVEGLPEIHTAGIANGALSTEVYYWNRGYDGDGWSCEAAADVALQLAGLVLRNEYPDLGIDLRKYSGALAGKYGRRPPPAPIKTLGQQHLLRTATTLVNYPDVRDAIAIGSGVSTCGGEGYSSSRDENGVSRLQGRWAHAMAAIGVDDRAEIIAKYGEPLILILNSWGVWNGGGRRVLGTTIDIPEGSFWARWSHVKNRTFIAMAGANGWQARSLPPFDLVVG